MLRSLSCCSIRSSCVDPSLPSLHRGHTLILHEQLAQKVCMDAHGNTSRLRILVPLSAKGSKHTEHSVSSLSVLLRFDDDGCAIDWELSTYSVSRWPYVRQTKNPRFVERPRQTKLHCCWPAAQERARLSVRAHRRGSPALLQELHQPERTCP